MAGDVRNSMIESATLLLAKRGLQGTSFSEVLEASGAPRGSLYHHFPGGKDELIASALDLAGRRAIDVLDGMSGQPAAVVAETFLGLWRSVLTMSQFRAGCAVTAVTVAADSSGQLDATAGIFRAWSRRLAELLAAGGVTKARSPGIAATLIAGSEGAVVVARAERDLAAFDLVASELLGLVRDASA
jgi:AcrR family transcriptional regulator